VLLPVVTVRVACADPGDVIVTVPGLIWAIGQFTPGHAPDPPVTVVERPKDPVKVPCGVKVI